MCVCMYMDMGGCERACLYVCVGGYMCVCFGRHGKAHSE